ncbi:putative oligomerization/nucleic acid binding protein [Haloactinopolyspora alba]|uniref:Putative oligomerization/nucleic acid binding protein n=1 Tax=Haloactinopolyspora alba TaxID=648780 RepID=A0A2P8E091_9ACTN|nr:putative oligomerization/nucleic acid binding protein [Haloactinopolyspora alba]
MQDGTWTFDGDTLRVVPSGDRRVHALRQALGERVIPLAAISGIAYEPRRKGGQLRLRLRERADPFLQVTSGKLADDADPYRLRVDKDSTGVAEYLVDEVRNALTIEQIPPGAADGYLLGSPAVPITASAGDGTVSFDGSRIRIEWTDWAEQVKKASGAREFTLDDVHGVEWTPIIGFTNGFLRFRVSGASALLPKHDPNCVTWGMRREGGTISLLAAAVVARLPHPAAVTDTAVSPGTTGTEHPGTTDTPPDQETVLRRLRELGELHRDGILTDSEFAEAKQALLRHL